MTSVKNYIETEDDIILIKSDDEIEFKMTENIIDNVSLNTTSLIFNNEFNNKIKKNDLPNNLKYIVFGEEYDKKIDISVLPSTLISLTFGKHYNQDIEPNVLPNGLMYLKMGEKYNREFKENSLPSSLVILEFDDFSVYNKPFKKNVLPNSLLKISFRNVFNQVIKPNVLPKNLKYLYLSKNFTKSIEENVLPDTLEYLYVYWLDDYKHKKNIKVISVECENMVEEDFIVDKLVVRNMKIVKNEIPYKTKNLKNINNNQNVFGVVAHPCINISNTVKLLQFLNYTVIDKDIVINRPLSCDIINEYGEPIHY